LGTSDLTYISYERLPKSWRRNEACPAIPELVIEIISPDQSMKEFQEKAKDYLAAGVPRVWVLDPEPILIKSFLTDGSSQVYTDNTLILDELLPGLELTTRQIFEEAELIDRGRSYSVQDISRRVRDHRKTLTRGGGTIDCDAPHASKALNNTLSPETRSVTLRDGF
jgi:hypothetical protein